LLKHPQYVGTVLSIWGFFLNAWCELTTDDYTEGAHSL
jgi:hypothetical protein